jgi:hypothetical protein
MCFVFPAIGVLFELLASVFGRRFRKAVHWFIVATLSAVIALQVLNKIFEFHGILLIMMASVLGVVATIVYVRLRPAMIFLTVLCPVILIFPGLFLFNSPVHKVLFPKKDPSAIDIKMDDPPPIIMVVFDEFPVTALMDEHQKIDPIRYPNFSALAEDAYWFRNAMTVAAQTTLIIPAILTGNLPAHGQQPTAADHPHNLFTLLGSTYDLKVLETSTQLCPAELCADAIFRGSVIERIDSLLRDISVVYLHMVLPADLTSALPAISQGWMNFVHPTAGHKELVKEKSQNKKMVRKRSLREKTGDRAWQFSKFIDSIVPADHPTLYFIHITLPHRRWEYLPSGKKFGVFSDNKIWDFLPHGKKLNAEKIMGTGIGAKRHEIWGKDEWVVTQAYQLFLLQVGFVDRLLGQLMERLKSLDLYERSLLVITADHGMGFRANDYTRIATESNAGDITSVPLFIKAPNQREGLVIDRKVETIDVFPTTADILKIKLPYPVDGRSAFDESLPERGETLFLNPRNFPDKFKFAKKDLLDIRYDTLKWKLKIFGSGEVSDGLYKIGPFKHLIGRRVQTIPMVEGNFAVELDQEIYYANVDHEAEFAPSRLTGSVLVSDKSEASFNLAISINGIVRAVTQTFPSEGGVAKWSAMVPERVFRMGKNDVEIFVVTQRAGKVLLERAKTHEKVTFVFSSRKGQSGETITCSDGRTISVKQNALRAYLDMAVAGKDQIVFAGWAADIKNSQLPEAIVIFVNGKFFYSGQCNVFKPKLAKAWHNDTLRWAGFKYVFPLSFFGDLTDVEVRIFAISKRGVASEVHYPKGYKWCKKPAQVSVLKDRHGRLKPKQTKEREGVSFVPYELISDKTIASADGKAIKVIPNAMKGYLGVAKIRGKQVIFSGWAADVKYSRLPGSILAFLDEKLVYSGKTDLERPDVAQHFKNSSLKMTGFKFMVPIHFFTGEVNPELRIFAVSKEGVATELKYPKNYKWGKK